MNLPQTDLSLDHLLSAVPPRLQQIWTPYLDEIPAPELKSALQYVLSNGGKRLRPLLVYAVASLKKAHWEAADMAAAAVEMLHTYSLVHDDLPCMDDASIRRGKPSCHQAYGEGLAVLAGDALQTLAFHVIAHHSASISTDRRLQMLQRLTYAAGGYGMAAGQALDMTLLSDHTLPIDLLLMTYRLKTGALFTSAIELGWLASADSDEMNLQALRTFGNGIGLAFQIQDDIFDIENPESETGKPQHADHANDKITFPKRFGIATAKEKVEELHDQALTAINYFGSRAQLLREISHFILRRNY